MLTDEEIRREAADIGRELADRTPARLTPRLAPRNDRHKKPAAEPHVRDPPSRTIGLTQASTIKVRPVRWLWDERLPLGALSLLGGREGIGKSTTLYTLAADVTRGRLSGCFAGSPRAVVVAATEDSWPHTAIPRLMAAGADLDLVFRVDVTTADQVEAALSVPRDLAELGRVCREVNAALIVLDPLLSRLDAGLDSHKDAEVRRALEPLVALADATGTAVVGILHVNKSTSTDPLTTLMASRAFAAVARAVLFVMVDPDDEQRRLLGQPKNNLGKADLPTLAFRIVGEKVAETAEGPVWTGRLEWDGESDRSIRDALEATVEASGDKTATSEAAAWLEDFVNSHNGSVESALAKREGSKAGHSPDALKRSRRKLGLVVESGGFPRRTYWKSASQSEQLVGATSLETLNTALTTPTGGLRPQSEQSEQPRETPPSLLRPRAASLPTPAVPTNA